MELFVFGLFVYSIAQRNEAIAEMNVFNDYIRIVVHYIIVAEIPEVFDSK